MGITNILGIIAFLIKEWPILLQLFSELKSISGGTTTSTTTSAPSILSEIISILEGRNSPVVASPTPVPDNAPAQAPAPRGRILGGLLGRILRRRK